LIGGCVYAPYSPCLATPLQIDDDDDDTGTHTDHFNSHLSDEPRLFGFSLMFCLRGRVEMDCPAWTVGLADQACPVFKVKRVNREQADLERRVNPDDQVLMDLMVCQVRRVSKAYQVMMLFVFYLHSCCIVWFKFIKIIFIYIENYFYQSLDQCGIYIYIYTYIFILNIISLVVLI